VAESKHHLGTATFQIDEIVLGPLVGDLEAEHSHKKCKLAVMSSTVSSGTSAANPPVGG
jgi:hypothetical protein